MGLGEGQECAACVCDLISSVYNSLIARISCPAVALGCPQCEFSRAGCLSGLQTVLASPWAFSAKFASQHHVCHLSYLRAVALEWKIMVGISPAVHLLAGQLHVLLSWHRPHHSTVS